MAGGSGGHGASVGVWIAVAIIIAGSIVGGIGLIEWIWPMFWIGAGLMVLGCVLAYFNDIMSQVSEFGSTSQEREAA